MNTNATDTATEPPTLDANNPPVRLTAALVAARAKFEPITKDKTNRHLNCKYASLAAILKATMPVLLEHGLTVTQELAPHPVFQGLAVLTTLRHVCGETLIVATPILVPDADLKTMTMQKLGSAQTYARRYGLAALLCIDADDESDDDGHAASQPAPRSEAQRPPARQDARHEDTREAGRRGREAARSWPKHLPGKFVELAQRYARKINDEWRAECEAAGIGENWSESDNLTNTHRVANHVATAAVEAGALKAEEISVKNPEGDWTRDRQRTNAALQRLYAANPVRVEATLEKYRANKLAEARSSAGIADRQVEAAQS